MWKLLIAEDEYEIRDGLCNNISWKDYDIELVKDVSNGKDAIEYLLNNPIDIVISDIVMPNKDGIELIRAMQHHKIDALPVIISVHWDRSYIKTAFKLDVEDYLLKPIKLEELHNTICKVVEKCQKAKEFKETKQRLEARIKDMEPLLKERFLNRIINGTIHNMEEIKDHINQLKLNINYETKCIFITLRFFCEYQLEDSKKYIYSLILI